jgi:NagD protein
MMRAARKELGLATDETIMIGDTMETDILGGASMGYRTLLVLSGSTHSTDLQRYAYRPDLVLDSIADLCVPEHYAAAVGALPEPPTLWPDAEEHAADRAPWPVTP